METDIILSQLNSIRQKAKEALMQKNLEDYASNFSEELKYTDINAAVFTKKLYLENLENYLKSVTDLTIEQYRIKHFMEGEVIIEKIAKKSVSKVKTFLLFSKKQTIQTEENIKWQINNGKWEIFEVEITLEEKY